MKPDRLKEIREWNNSSDGSFTLNKLFKMTNELLAYIDELTLLDKINQSKLKSFKDLINELQATDIDHRREIDRLTALLKVDWKPIEINKLERDTEYLILGLWDINFPDQTTIYHCVWWGCGWTHPTFNSDFTITHVAPFHYPDPPKEE